MEVCSVSRLDGLSSRHKSVMLMMMMMMMTTTIMTLMDTS